MAVAPLPRTDLPAGVAVDDVARATNPTDLRRRLYVEHEDAVRRLVGSYVARLDLGRRLGRFGVDELIDAGRDGLWEATALWNDAVNDHFMTYAWFYVMGRVKERRDQLQRTVPPPSEPGSWDGSPADGDPDVMTYVEERLAAVAADRRLSLAVTALETHGLLRGPEAVLARALRAGGFRVTGLDGDLGLGTSELKTGALRLLHKLHAWVRDDAPFEDAGLPADRAAPLRPLALARARSALHHSSGGATLATRPLAEHGRLLADVPRDERPGRHVDDRRPGPADVLSFYRAAGRLTLRDVSQATGLSLESLQQLARGGRLSTRQSPARMASLANALSIPSCEILLRALPELTPLFGRVAHVGDGVYLALIETALPPAAAMAFVRCPDDGVAAHAFAPLLRAHRLAAGASTAAALGPRQEDLEEGRGVAPEHVAEVAARLGLDPLLLLLGTWPELRVLFDVIDERGRLLNEAAVDHARLVLAVRQGPTASARPAPPAPGLATYVAHLLAGHPERLLPEALAAHGVSQRLVAGALRGTPPRLAHLHALASALRLGPLQAVRLAAETLLASGRPARDADLRQIIQRLAREEQRRQQAWSEGRGDGLDDGLDDLPLGRLMVAFDEHVSVRRRPEAATAGLDAFLDGALAVTAGRRLPAFARLRSLVLDEDAEEALHTLWRAGVLDAGEAALLQGLVLRPSTLFALVRETGLGYHGTVEAMPRLLARIDRLG
jgi:transcriptional regulator with XRE-family HTH domain